MVKKTTAKKPLIKAQKGMFKSKKVRTSDLNMFGPSSASVSKTNRKGTTVTKSVDTSQGFVPYASQTKTVTDAQGNTTSATEDMNWNKALRKQEKIAKKVGRNPNDEARGDFQKKGGATKAKKVVKPMMKAGGSTAGKTTPLYSNDPRTSQGRMVKKGGVAKTTYKKGGTTKKAVSAGMKKGGTVKRKK